jgi:hypothetical protein
MSLFDLYSQSQRATPVSFVYNQFPRDLKIQCIHTWNEFFAQERIPMESLGNIYIEIAKIVMKEHALSTLPDPLYRTTYLDKVNLYFESISDVNKSLDIVQILCFYMEHLEDHLSAHGYNWPLLNKGKEAIAEINERFKRRGIGYQYGQDKIIRLDNQLLHAEAVDRTFQLLLEPQYSNVSKEYLTAHDHFRHRRNADCLTWSLKAFESVMKVVADRNGWKYDKGAAAKDLIQLLFEKHFFPPYLSNAMAGLRNFLESSMPTIRNKKGGHGSGSVVNEVPDSLAQYMIYITGSTLNWIVEIQQERNGK